MLIYSPTAQRPFPFRLSVRSVPSFTMNNPGNRFSQGLLAAGILPRVRLDRRHPRDVRRQPGQSGSATPRGRSGPARTGTSCTSAPRPPAAATALCPLHAFSRRPCSPSRAPAAGSPGRVSDSSITTGRSFARLVHDVLAVRLQVARRRLLDVLDAVEAGRRLLLHLRRNSSR